MLDKDKLKVKVEAELNVSQKIGEGRSKKSWTNEKTMMIIVFCMVFCKGNNSLFLIDRRGPILVLNYPSQKHFTKIS